MNAELAIEHYADDLDNLVDFFRMSTSIESLEGVSHLVAVERARGTRYYVARLDGRIVGFMGLWFDPTGAISVLEPPQVIDVAVMPEYRRQGVGRALMAVAARETLAAGYDRLWLYTGGDSPGLLTFYLRLGYQLISVVPGWFGDGTAKAILCLNLSPKA